MNHTDPLNLLWTGGWDSTFRLLWLVLEAQKPVVPWYVIDPQRPSLRHELQAMYRIREAITAKYPAAAPLIFPVRFRALGDLAARPASTALYEEMNRISTVGIQYEWLARLPFVEGIESFDLCLQGSANGMTYWQARTIENLESVQENGVTNYRVRENPEPVLLRLYERIRFQAVHVSKPEMADWVRAHDCLGILEMSWFCHRPRTNGTPCGLCTPCRIAMSGGMAYRLPPASKVRWYLKETLSGVRRRLGQQYQKIRDNGASSGSR